MAQKTLVVQVPHAERARLAERLALGTFERRGVAHAVFSVKEAFLMEVTHAPIGVLGAFSGWGRWVELRLPEAGRTPGWLSTLCLTAVGLILVVYREA